MKISIITVTYNSEKTVEDTIRSVLKQTYEDIEYIIVDGGSQDSTVGIASRYEPMFNGRMKLVSEKDDGIYDAMNKGIGMATGEVIGILNSDDYFTSDSVVEKVSKGMEGVDAVYGDIHYINDKRPDKCVRYYSSKIFHPSFLRFGLVPPHPSFYVRKDIYEKYGYYSIDYKIAADYDMMVRLFHKYRIKTRYIPIDFVTMRIGGVSTKSISNRCTGVREKLRACRRYGINTNIILICFKYFLFFFEMKFIKVK